jgi:hypothetical protein
MSIEEAILEAVRALPEGKQREILTTRHAYLIRVLSQDHSRVSRDFGQISESH